MSLEVIALLALVGTTGIAASGLWMLNRRVAAVADQLTRTAAVRAEAVRMKQANDRLAEWQEVTELTIDSSTQAVRAVHKGIASIPFSILESIPATRDTAKVVREIHDFTSDNVYAAIGAVNRLAGERGRELLNGPTGNPDVIENPTAEKPSSTE